MIAAGWNVVLTHGNGPQVGFILRRSEIATGQVPTVPIRYAVADTQGAIGFMFQNAMVNALKRRGIDKQVVTLVTQTVVDTSDPAFAHPDKPVGSFMSEEAARDLAAELGWTVMQDGVAAGGDDRVAAAGPRDRGADHRAPRARRRDDHRAGRRRDRC
jgi:carbamate kinase